MGDDKGFYDELSQLRPWKARPLPMLRKMDGSFARTQEEIASRWVEHVSLEMGGFPSSFEELSANVSPLPTDCTALPPLDLSYLPLPSLDDVLDRLMASAKGKALGPDSIPIELVILGGLPAARLVHSLVVGSWKQRRPPFGWRGGRAIHLPKPGSSYLECGEQRGIMINDHLATLASRLLRPQLLAFEPLLVPSSQAVGSRRRGSVQSAHCSWALFSAAAEAKVSVGALYSDIKRAYYSVIRQYVV